VDSTGCPPETSDCVPLCCSTHHSNWRFTDCGSIFTPS